MRFVLLFFIFILLSVSFAWADPVPAPYSRNVEIRAVWLDRRSIPGTEQGIRELIRRYSKAGINLIHPEVIFNGYSAYPSSFLTEKNIWNGLDVLKIILDEAHKRHMEVHPWVWVFRAGNVNDKGGILAKHPDWVAVDVNGKAETSNGSYWLCPSIPEVRQLLLNAYKELATKYPIDGIHLDYIRFESQSPVPYCYNKSCREGFEAKYKIDPINIEPFTLPVLDWHLWRENLIDSFVEEVNAEMKKIDPRIQVSAAVGSPYNSARLDLLQNWTHWADNKWVDFLSTMDYTSSPVNFLNRINSSAENLSNRALLSPGIGLHVLKGIPAVLEQVQLARSAAVSGVTLFASSYLNDDLLDTLMKGLFHDRAKLPIRKPAESSEEMISSAKKRIRSAKSMEDLMNAGLDIKAAGRLVDNAAYRMNNIGYIPPQPPPIFIPARVQPLPRVDVPKISGVPVIDGVLNDPVWQQTPEIHITTTNLGRDATQISDIRLAYDDKNLYLGFKLYEPRIDQIKAAVTEHNGPVFQDDSIELFINPGSSDTSYYQFAVNTLNTHFEQKIGNSGWNAEWQSAVVKNSDSWSAEIAIPFSSIGITEPPSRKEWRVNFCRNRFANGEGENSCWSETYGTYHTPSRFGIAMFGN